MGRRTALRSVAPFLIALLACAGAFHPTVRVKAQTPPTASANFRVVLTGFRVNHESNDDILEGDGRGDEVFITAHRWVINRDGSARPVPLDDPSSNFYGKLPYLRTKIMGDPNGHPERVPAGTKSPGALNTNLDALHTGGLQTGDTFPTRTPWRRDREPLADRPPIVLWQGELTRGQNMVEIVPIIWEWDSDYYSASQQAILDGGLTSWFEEHRQKLADHIPASDVKPLPASPRGVRPDYGSALGYNVIALDDKSGTRPIGYLEDGGWRAIPYFRPQPLVLTYDSAMSAAHPRDVGDTLAITYKDTRDNGDYTLYFQVEQVTTMRHLAPLKVRRP